MGERVKRVCRERVGRLPEACERDRRRVKKIGEQERGGDRRVRLR